jgi:hypothetical protein
MELVKSLDARSREGTPCSTREGTITVKIVRSHSGSTEQHLGENVFLAHDRECIGEQMDYATVHSRLRVQRCSSSEQPGFRDQAV